MALLESNSFVSNKFVSNRKSKKWDVPPSALSPAARAKKSTLVKGSSDVGTVDPSEYVPKVVPLSEVEGAMQRGGGGEGGEGVVEGEEGVCGESIAKREINKTSDSTAEVRHLVCLYTRMAVSIYICIYIPYVCLYLYLRMYVCLYVWLYLYISVCMYVSVCVSVCMAVSIYACLSRGLCEYLSVCLSLCPLFSGVEGK